ncbi:MAG: bis(5'-nucleosyl)-tetraphosphatase (symmetrical) YqeK [Clostridia bacterium]|nr:bis(5'-nucleosyl)-tetraphosphatase (symmetrical) YqeK [Clostridia bacterium]
MRIGFFGGAFDPFHSEHEAAVTASLQELRLDKLVLVPSQNPPHKDSPVTDFWDRAAMLTLWASGKSNIVIDTIEAETGDTTNCSYRIIRLLKDKYQADAYFYIIGGDSMINFHTWVKPEVIAKEITLAVIAREGYPTIDTAIQNARKLFHADIVKLNACGKEVSSGEIKARLELDMDTHGFFDKRIQDYIQSKGLYSTYSELVNHLKNAVSPSLFAHCARTAVFAAKYCTLAKVSYHKAFVAGLLHDCAKEMPCVGKNYPTDAPQVIHQYMGAEIAEEIYGICDKEILDAIACHTTGKPAMSRLDKLIYIADKLEEGRDYEGIDTLRSTLYQGFDTAFVELVRHNADYLLKRGIKADNLTNECLEYYTNTNKS